MKRYLSLLHALTVRDIQARYKGSWLGVFWSILNPILLLLVYGFVFGVVFNARWPQVDGQNINFSLLLFCGLIIHMMFADVLIRSSSIILQNENYVKKVVFPLTIFGGVVSLSSAFNFVISFAVLMAYSVILGVGFSLSFLLFPLLLLQFLIFCLGVSWLVGSLGVFFRDINYVVGFLSTAMMFLSPIFYPATAVPEGFQVIIKLNPLTYYIETFREISIYGGYPEASSAGVAFLIAAAVFLAGLTFFRKTKSVFADVL